MVGRPTIRSDTLVNGKTYGAWPSLTAILPLVPYLDTLRWVFIAVAIVGIGVAIYARIDDWKRGQR